MSLDLNVALLESIWLTLICLSYCRQSWWPSSRSHCIGKAVLLISSKKKEPRSKDGLHQTRQWFQTRRPHTISIVSKFACWNKESGIFSPHCNKNHHRKALPETGAWWGKYNEGHGRIKNLKTDHTLDFQIKRSKISGKLHFALKFTYDTGNQMSLVSTVHHLILQLIKLVDKCEKWLDDSQWQLLWIKDFLLFQFQMKSPNYT